MGDLRKRPTYKQLFDGNLLWQLNFHTSSSEERVARYRRAVQRFDGDEKQIERIRRKECKSCFYMRGPVVATQSFEQANCKMCDEPFQHSNGDIPDLCTKCPDRYNMCRRCGGDLDGKQRKILEPKKR